MHHARNPEPLLQLHEANQHFGDLEDGEPRESVFAEATLRPPGRCPIDEHPLPPATNTSYLEQS
ncbi:hypothetical protein ACFVXH_07665 [Kitasatospora sp. NPDC058184]|uniref:hypothetical protein n=1 Tax=Kitasatospora sp. NPDC058184 TaxID=3346370 RepID=UPI0036DF87EA